VLEVVEQQWRRSVLRQRFSQRFASGVPHTQNLSDREENRAWLGDGRQLDKVDPTWELDCQISRPPAERAAFCRSRPRLSG
jgi:hypothetical protein